MCFVTSCHPTVQCAKERSVVVTMLATREKHDMDEARFYNPCPHVGLALGATAYTTRCEFDLFRPGSTDGVAPTDYSQRRPHLLASSSAFGYLFVGCQEGTRPLARLRPRPRKIPWKCSHAA
jgi:hypothetical protein